MSPKPRKYFSGNTLEQALMQAARHYDVDPDSLAYKPVEKKHGFLRTPRRVLIEIDSDQPTRAAAEKAAPKKAAPKMAAPKPPPEKTEAEEPRSEDRPPRRREAEDEAEAEAPSRPPRRRTPREDDEEPRRGKREERKPAEEAAEDTDTDTETDDSGAEERRERKPRRRKDRGGGKPKEMDPEVLEAAREAAEKLIDLSGLDVDATVSDDGHRVVVELEGPDQDLLLEEDGDALQAFEYLLPRVIRGIHGRPVPCRVDSGGFHAAREDRLRETAREIADEVRDRGRSRTLPPMNPGERRIVHLELVDDPDVETESEGDGYFKRVKISPA